MVSDECRVANDVVFDPSNPQVMYAIWKNPWFGDLLPKLSRSDDGGNTWSTITLDKQRVSGPNRLLIHPTVNGEIFIGDAGLGIVRTTDGGDHWDTVNTGLNAVVVFDVAVDPNDSSHILAGAISGLYERKANTPWERLVPISTRSLAFHPTDSNTFYAGIYGHLLKTNDGGLVWDDNFTPGAGSAGGSWTSSDFIGSSDVSHIEISRADPDTSLFVALGQSIYQSTDGGTIFNEVLTGENQAGETYFMNVVAIDPHNPNHLYAGGGNFWAPKIVGDLWESTDGGGIWSRTGLTDVIVNDLLIDPQDPDTLYAGCGYSGGTETPVFKSTDGGATWLPASQGMPPSVDLIYAIWGFDSGPLHIVGYGNSFLFDGNNFSDVPIDPAAELFGIWGPDNANVFAVGSSGMIQRFDGTGWSPMVSGTSERLLAVWGTTASNIYAVGLNGTILHFDGTDWTPMISGTTNNLHGVWGTGPDNIFTVGDKGTILHYNGQQWAALASNTVQSLNDVWADDSQNIFAVGDAGTILFYNGISWISMLSGTARELKAVWGNSPDNVYAVGQLGTILHYNGVQWVPANLDRPLPLSDIWGDSNSAVYTISDVGGVFQYDGRTWTVLREPGDNGRAVTDLEFHAKTPGVIYAGTQNAGIFVSPNAADRWLNLGTPAYNIYAISVGSVYAATRGGLLQCTGTGVLAGEVHSMTDGRALDGATVYTDGGFKTVSINGDFMMVTPTGIFDITSVAEQHANATMNNVEIYGGDITWVTVDMQSGLAGPVDTSSSPRSTSTGSGYSCFIHVAENSGTLPTVVSLYAQSARIISFLIAITLFIPCFNLQKKFRKRYMAVLMVIFLPLFLTTEADAGTIFQQVGIASSPNPVGSGARALGMGGAFIAVADDATAASWNPAGLIQLEKPEFSIVGDYINRREAFSSSINPEIDTSGSVDYSSLNFISATMPFKWFRNMVVSLNYQRLYDFKREFNYLLNFSDAGVNLAQQKEFSQDGDIGALGIAGAIEITPTISFGATLNIWTDQLFWNNGWSETFIEKSTGTIGGTPVNIDTYIDDKYSRFRGINANFGLLWNVIPSLTIGAVFKTPFTASLRHEFNLRQTQVFGPPVDSTIPNTISFREDVELNMPMSYGIGLAWRVSDNLTFDFDAYRTHWSKYILKDSLGNKFSPIDGRPENLSDVDDTTQLRLGAEYLMIFPNKQMAVPLRAGFFYDPEPAEKSIKNFYGIALGSGIAYKRLVFDLAYNFRWGNGVDTGNLIANSEADVRQHSLIASLILHLK